VAIKHIRELPNELPHARIYLDDLDEIREILIEACTTARETFRKEMKYDGKTEITVIYRVDDLRIDSVEDLVEDGSRLA
jgi:hypothetical protein